MLVASARAVERNLHETDVFARVGGEEFVVLLPDTNLDGATELAERLRGALLAISPLVTDVDIRVSASLGVVELDQGSEDETGESRIADADAALYNAKRLGRNKVFSERLPEHDQVAEHGSLRHLPIRLRRHARSLADCARRAIQGGSDEIVRKL